MLIPMVVNAAVWVRVIGYSKLFREGSRYRPMIRAHEPIDVISQTLPTLTILLIIRRTSFVLFSHLGLVVYGRYWCSVHIVLVAMVLTSPSMLTPTIARVARREKTCSLTFNKIAYTMLVLLQSGSQSQHHPPPGSLISCTALDILSSSSSQPMELHQPRQSSLDFLFDPSSP